jgi:hypothetical protein
VPDDIARLRAEYHDLADYAKGRIDSMNMVEREELREAMQRMDARFDRFDHEAREFREQVGLDINSLKRDMAFIKGATKIAAMVVTIGVPALFAAIGWFLK